MPSGSWLAVWLSASLALPAGAQPVDEELALGLRQVQEGEYDAALLTLDAVTRRLARDPSRARDRAQAHLHLGIAYLAKGHESAARSSFREAIRLEPGLTLSPERFSPRVIDLFEAARDEERRATAATGAGASSPAPSPGPSPSAKRGSRRGLVLLGIGGLAAAGGAALALKGGEGFCDTVFENRSGLLRQPNDASAELMAGPAAEAGAWTADLSWSESAGAASLGRRVSSVVDVLLVVADAAGNTVAMGGLISPAKRKAEWQGAAGTVYRARASLPHDGTPVTYTLDVAGPCK